MRRAMLIALLLTAVPACAVQTQAGQTRPPFELWVIFRPHTSTAVAANVLSDCRHQPEVIRVGQIVTYHGALRGTVYTKSFGNSGRTKALLGCLHAAKSVQFTEFPD